MGRRPVLRLDDTQTHIFQANFRYMLDSILNVSNYELRHRKMGLFQKLNVLPAYSIMSKCYYCADADSQYYPTITIVRKVVEFFNANIAPATTSDEFTTVKLAQTSNTYTLKNSKLLLYNKHFMSKYMVFYYGEDGVKCGLFEIYTPVEYVDNPDGIRASMILGLRSEKMFVDSNINKLLNVMKNPKKNPASVIDLEKEQYHAYKGEAQLTDKALVAELSDVTDTRRKMFITMDITAFFDTDINRERNYLGGLAYAMTANGPLGIRIMRLATAEAKTFSGQISMDEVEKYLSIPKCNYVRLDDKIDRTWYNFLAAKRRAEN